MNERITISQRMNRRELLQSAGLVLGVLGLVGADKYAANKAERTAEEEDRQDHYKGIQLDAYANGTFSLIVGRALGSDNTYATEDPVNQPEKRFDVESIYQVNNKYVVGEIHLMRPGIVFAENPSDRATTIPWVVLNTTIAEPSDTSLESVYRPKTHSQLVYVNLSKELNDPNNPVTLVPLTTNPDGTHCEARTGKPVMYLGAVTF